VKDRPVCLRQHGGLRAPGHARTEVRRPAGHVTHGFVKGGGDGGGVARGRVDVALASLLWIGQQWVIDANHRYLRKID
jgi:hypothetical protein